jgi:ERCC4-type nuclease
MSVLLDDREDTGLSDHLARFGLPIMTTRLDFGDLVIQSCDGRLIGYERKRLTDLIACMQDRRLAGHQLQGMRSAYDRVEIVVEGLWRPGENGEIEVAGRGQWTPLYHRGSGISYRQVDSYLYSQYECGGVPFYRTGGPYETACLYASRYHWWQKDYELHRSHDVLFSNNPSAQRRGAVLMHQGEPNAVTILAAQIPGIDAKAWSVGKHFKSPFDMITADASDWRTVAWTDRKNNVKHFGKETAKQIVGWLRGESQ